MKTLTVSTNTSYLFTLLLIILSFNFSNAQCADPDTFETGCGDGFDLCTDFAVTDVNVPVHIPITSNDLLGIFNPCDLKFSTEPGAAPKHGTSEMMSPGQNCDIMYSPDLDFVGLDSFDYVLRVRNICAGSYCGNGEGKIWTMNNAYYGPTGATVTVSSKNVVFTTITNLTNGNDFFINGKSLPNSNSNWTFNFYFDGNTAGSPDETADVHTSCSALIFGVDFGIFSPIAGCIATQSDKANCSESEIQAISNAQYRAINDYSVTEILDTTTVYVLIIEGGLLPIDFGFISGRAIGKDNFISWGINSVVGEKELILQKSSDGRKYQDLSSYVDPKAGDYNYTDSSAKNIRTYYRFKLIAVNGTESFSDAIIVTNNNITKDLNIFPLPASDEINFNSDDVIKRVAIYDLTGKLVFENNFDTNQVSISRSQLQVSKGIYLSRVLLDSGESVTRKISLL